MADINSCTFTGCLGREPELKRTTDGRFVCRFRLAVTRPKIKGAAEADVDWLDIVAWNGMAEACAEYLTKGSKVAVSAVVRVRSWQDKNKCKRISTEFVADEIKFFTISNNTNTAVPLSELEELATDGELPFD